MRWFAFPIVLLAAASVLPAQHPDRRNQPVRQPIDLIGPLGNRLPPSYRRTYNRPTYIGGKIAYWIAPSSQEAMAWQAAYRSGAYREHAPRLERHFFFPKPWEALQVGPRDSSQSGPADSGETPTPAEELPRQQDPLSGPPQPSPVVVSQLERETTREHDGFDREFGAILLADPTAFRPDETPDETPAETPDETSATTPPDANQSNREKSLRHTGADPTEPSRSPRDTLRRLRAENEQLRRSLESSTN